MDELAQKAISKNDISLIRAKNLKFYNKMLKTADFYNTKLNINPDSQIKLEGKPKIEGKPVDVGELVDSFYYLNTKNFKKTNKETSLTKTIITYQNGIQLEIDTSPKTYLKEKFTDLVDHTANTIFNYL